MVGPVNNASAQQIAIANPFQKQDNQQVENKRQQEETSQTQESGKTENSSEKQANTVQTASASQQEPQRTSGGGDRERGSLVDISV